MVKQKLFNKYFKIIKKKTYCNMIKKLIKNIKTLRQTPNMYFTFINLKY